MEERRIQRRAMWEDKMEFYRIISLGDNTSIPKYYKLLFTETRYDQGAYIIFKTSQEDYIMNKNYNRNRKCAYIIDIREEDRTHLRLLGIDISIVAVIFGKRLTEVYNDGFAKFQSCLQPSAKKREL